VTLGPVRVMGAGVVVMLCVEEVCNSWYVFQSCRKYTIHMIKCAIPKSDVIPFLKNIFSFFHEMKKIFSQKPNGNGVRDHFCIFKAIATTISNNWEY